MQPIPHEVKRADILSGVIDYIAQHGVSGLSLRPLAAELGTSARMLVHYFGSKEKMLIAALETQRPDITEAFADVHDAQTLRMRLLDGWIANTSGAATRSTTVVLQVLGQAAVQQDPYLAYARAAIEVLVSALTQVLQRIDPSVENPQASATLLVSGIRGLVLDRLVTSDSDRVDTAARQLIDQTLSNYNHTARH
ncbi:TetR/AcrR family transcriptional regulator [Nocardia sp. NPDC059239]|uniref:TetR/AcrR family transcriptional regulator n=1 Tax=unclassified Nocardia TaxID=2637762 RepID=UPI0036C6E814